MALFTQFAAIVRSPSVLPDNGVVDRLACSPIPDECGFALVGYTNGCNVASAKPCAFDRGTASGDRGGPQVRRIVLYPTAVGKLLWEFLLCSRRDLHGFVENNRTTRSRALIDGKDVAHGLPSFSGWNRISKAGYSDNWPMSRLTGRCQSITSALRQVPNPPDKGSFPPRPVFGLTATAFIRRPKGIPCVEIPARLNMCHASA